MCVIFLIRNPKSDFLFYSMFDVLLCCNIYSLVRRRTTISIREIAVQIYYCESARYPARFQRLQIRVLDILERPLLRIQQNFLFLRLYDRFTIEAIEIEYRKSLQ